MPELKATPGPWGLCFHLQSAENDASCPCGYRGGIWGADGQHVVCEIGSTAIPGEEALSPARYDRPTELANAHLIAAAPELYEMTVLLERCVEYDIRRSEADGDDEGANLKRFTLAQVRAVLAQARGEVSK